MKLGPRTRQTHDRIDVIEQLIVDVDLRTLAGDLDDLLGRGDDSQRFGQPAVEILLLTVQS